MIGAVINCSGRSSIPSARSLARIAERGLLVVFVTIRNGISFWIRTLSASAAPGTSAPASMTVPSKSIKNPPTRFDSPTPSNEAKIAPADPFIRCQETFCRKPILASLSQAGRP
jgi:hypothetical protein